MGIIERPILMQTEMVQAIDKDWKSNTRRTRGLELINLNPSDWKLLIYGQCYVPAVRNKKAKEGFGAIFTGKESKAELIFCPYGNIGDILWVRETWGIYSNEFYYKALTAEGEELCKWKPSIHMPRIAARNFLNITAIRVERLQDISEKDAIAEGVYRWVEERIKSKPTHYKVYCDLENPHDPALYSSSAIGSFQTLWHDINGLESWNANPWVWVISFERVSNHNVKSTTKILSYDSSR